MTDWATFAAATVAVTLALLYLTRRSQRTLERVRIVDDVSEFGATNDTDDGPPRTFDHPDAVDRDFDDLDTPVANAAEPFLEVDGETGLEADEDSSIDADETMLFGGDDDAPIDDFPGASDERADSERGEPVLTTDLLLANVALSQGVALAVLVAIAWWADVPAEAFGLVASDLAGSVLLAGVAAGVVLYLGNEAAAGLGERFGVTAPERLRKAMAPSDRRGWALLLLVVLPVIAVFEEALFRGALIGAFAVGLGVDPWLLAVVSSVAFGFGHGAQGRLGIAVTGALGFVLAAIFVVTGSLLLVIVAHYVVNALEFVVREGLGWDPTGASESSSGGA